MQKGYVLDINSKTKSADVLNIVTDIVCTVKIETLTKPEIKRLASGDVIAFKQNEKLEYVAVPRKAA